MKLNMIWKWKKKVVDKDNKSDNKVNTLDKKLKKRKEIWK